MVTNHSGLPLGLTLQCDSIQNVVVVVRDASMWIPPIPPLNIQLSELSETHTVTLKQLEIQYYFDSTLHETQCSIHTSETKLGRSSRETVSLERVPIAFGTMNAPVCVDM